MKGHLPTCHACGKAITFYAHQQYVPNEGMRYFHPKCCVECLSRPKERDKV